MNSRPSFPAAYFAGMLIVAAWLATLILIGGW